jgi:hypothetical protein
MHKMAQNGVGKDPREPLDTAMAGAAKHAAVTAFLSSFYGSDKPAAAASRAAAAHRPRRRRRGGGHHAVVAAHIEQANTGMVGHTPRKPLSTIVGKGCTQRIVETTLIEEGALPPEMMERAVRVAAFLVKYYATDGDNEVAQSQRVDRPLDTITTKARFAVVTVTIDAVTYVIVDIGLRMLKPRELARAQGFPEDYVLDPIVPKFVRGKWVERRLTIAEQISAIGNSVCPPVARALVAANQPARLVEQTIAIERAASSRSGSMPMIVGRPVARALQEPSTAELLRCCVSPAAPRNATSKLAARAKRVWQQMGGRRLVSYTLKRESGASMRGAGFQEEAEVTARRWDTPSRRRQARAIEAEDKIRWAVQLPELPL